MKRLFALAVLTLPALAGCVSSNSTEGRQSEAYARCSYSPGPKEREECMKAQMALLEARDRKADAQTDADRAAAEQRQAVLEASGVPRDQARKAVGGGDTPN